MAQPTLRRRRAWRGRWRAWRGRWHRCRISARFAWRRWRRRSGPDPRGRLSALGFFQSKSSLCGGFVWGCRALSRQKRRFPARQGGCRGLLPHVLPRVHPALVPDQHARRQGRALPAMQAPGTRRAAAARPRARPALCVAPKVKVVLGSEGWGHIVKPYYWHIVVRLTSAKRAAAPVILRSCCACSWLPRASSELRPLPLLPPPRARHVLSWLSWLHWLVS